MLAWDETDRQTDRERETETERKTETDAETEREGEGERGWVFSVSLSLSHTHTHSGAGEREPDLACVFPSSDERFSSAPSLECHSGQVTPVILHGTPYPEPCPPF